TNECWAVRSRGRSRSRSPELWYLIELCLRRVRCDFIRSRLVVMAYMDSYGESAVKERSDDRISSRAAQLIARSASNTSDWQGLSDRSSLGATKNPASTRPTSGTRRRRAAR